MGLRDDSDASLAARAAAGDAAAFDALAARHYDRVYRLAWRWLGRRTQAEDVAQDVMVKLALAIRGWRGEAAFTTWLYRIVYTTAVDQMRADQRMQPVEPSQMSRLIDGPVAVTAEDAVIGAELWAQVRALPVQQRDAVLLVYGEDMSHAEAADVMGCAETTVSWHLHAARKALRVKLEAVG